MLWANIENTFWYVLEQVPLSQVLFWTHICTGLDLDQAVIRTSVNGRPVQLVEEAVFSTLIGRAQTMLSSHWSRACISNVMP